MLELRLWSCSYYFDLRSLENDEKVVISLIRMIKHAGRGGLDSTMTYRLHDLIYSMTVKILSSNKFIASLLEP
jgi:hypothetical protein